MDSALLCEDFCLNKSFCRFDTHEAAQLSVDYLSGLKLDGQTIRVEMDWGYSDGRHYGRASNGGQMRHYINDIKNSGKNYSIRYSNHNDRRGYHDNRDYYRKRDREGADREDKRRRY